ncbi:MAG: hypothetical protein RLZZ515_2712, partial [Cyanobacteriota bacterium]
MPPEPLPTPPSTAPAGGEASPAGDSSVQASVVAPMPEPTPPPVVSPEPPVSAVTPTAPSEGEASPAGEPSVQAAVVGPMPEPTPPPAVSPEPLSSAVPPGGPGGTIDLRGQVISLEASVLDASGGVLPGAVRKRDGVLGAWTYQIATVPSPAPLTQEPLTPPPTLAPVDLAQNAVKSPVAPSLVPVAAAAVDVSAVAPNPAVATTSSQGGSIAVRAGQSLTISSALLAISGLGAGGAIQIASGGSMQLSNPGSLLDASGRTAGGQVQLSAAGSLELSGQVLASGEGEAARGGLVELGAQTLHLQGVVVDASGQGAGGDILVGGGERGASMSAGISLAEHLTVDAATQLRANARANGDGGRVITYAVQDATINGQLEARGGQAGGNGGFLETSASTLWLGESLALSAASPQGERGTWLIDPTNFTISEGSGPRLSNSIGALTLQSELNANNANILIETAAANSEGDLGDIFVDAPLSWSAGKLTLSAYRNIFVNASIAA